MKVVDQKRTSLSSSSSSSNLPRLTTAAAGGLEAPVELSEEDSSSSKKSGQSDVAQDGDHSAYSPAASISSLPHKSCGLTSR